MVGLYIAAFLAGIMVGWLVWIAVDEMFWRRQVRQYEAAKAALLPTPKPPRLKSVQYKDPDSFEWKEL